MKLAPGIYIGRYATAWEVQIGRLWAGVLFPRYWRTSGLVFMKFLDKE